MMDDNESLRLAIAHCQEVIDRCQQSCLCKDQHEQLKRWLMELLRRRCNEEDK